MMVSTHHDRGGSPGGKKSTFMSVDRGSYHPFTTSAYLLCKQDRFVLLILVLTQFYAEDGSAKWMASSSMPFLWHQEPQASPLSITPLFGPFSHLLLLVGPHPEPIPLGPTATGPTAPLEGALDLLDSVPLPEAPQALTPFTLYLSVELNTWRRLTACHKLGQAALYSQAIQCYFLFI